MLTARRPLFLELRPRRPDAADRQMQPFHAATLNLGAELGYGEQAELVRLNQRGDRLGVPGGDGVEVFGEVTRPGAANRVAILLARCEGDAKLSRALDPCRRRRSIAYAFRWSLSCATLPSICATDSISVVWATCLVGLTPPQDCWSG